LLSPRRALIEIAASKQRTAEWLRRHDVPSPPGRIVAPGETPALEYRPAILKPVDGCGSLGVRRIDSSEELHAALRNSERPLRLERFIPGLACSVAVLCGPAQQIALPACEQRLAEDFGYLGGRTPLACELDERARRLALAAVATLFDPIGYIGVDLVLGQAADGSGDCVIEINPRLTTSYVGLRAACRQNLAAAMLALAARRSAALSFHQGPVEFDADGTICTQAR
jgi:predicted ATP-grasp superfamily ATP-dependent carboligase